MKKEHSIFIGWEKDTAWDLFPCLRLFYSPFGLIHDYTARLEINFVWLRFIFEYRIDFNKNWK